MLLAESHGVLREGLRCILESHRDVEVVGAVGNGNEAVREIERQKPSVAIVGIALPGLDGMAVMRDALQKAPGSAVVILSSNSSSQAARRAMDAGAVGYVGGDSTAEDVVEAVRAAAAGRRFISPDHDVAAGARAGTRAGHAESITSTERSILKLVVEGRSNTKVAEVLGLSPRTVETYRLRLMRKLGIEDLPALVKYAIRHGITTVD